MPQASDELRAKMKEYFGDEVDDAGPTKFLEEAGYTLTKGFMWKAKPGVEVIGDMADKERDCLLFLIQEWDYGVLGND